MRDDLPAIAIISFTIVAVVRAWTTRHRRRHVTIIIEDRTNGNGGATKPPAPSPEGQDEGLDEG